MSHTVTGKLNKAANIFQAGDSSGFGVRLGVKFRNRETGADEWTNYSAAIFAKSPNQIAFYQQMLVEGAIISVSAEKLQIEEYNGNHSIKMHNATLEFAHNPNQQAAPQQAAPQQQYNQAPQQAPAYQQQPSPQQAPASYGHDQRPAPQQAPSQYNDPSMDFDDDIPFLGIQQR